MLHPDLPVSLCFVLHLAVFSRLRMGIHHLQACTCGYGARLSRHARNTDTITLLA